MDATQHALDRRRFLGLGAGCFGVLGLRALPVGSHEPPALPSAPPLFKISLAEWSLHRALEDDKLDNLDFPAKARSFGIDAVEYVNLFFMDKARDQKYLVNLAKRCADEGVKSLLIMCDREGAIGDPDEGRRKTAVENHHKWIDAAVALGCHSIRVNAQSAGSWAEQQKLAADGLRRLCEYGDEHRIDVIVENHGGLSSNGKWLSETIRLVDHPRCGTLPDFGNFGLGKDEPYDRYLGVGQMMPFARGVSAKSHDFDKEGNETGTDFGRMLDLVVLEHGWRGYVGVEYEGDRLPEEDGIRRTKRLLERVRSELAARLEKKAEKDGGR